MLYYKKILILDIKRREFIAKVTADLGKTIFAIGLASYFFERFSHVLKVALWLICIILIIGSFFIHPEDKTGE
mgnify:CR=1 FL=1